MDETYAEVGTRVVLGRHTTVRGGRNWHSSMDCFVGKITAITCIEGNDVNGCLVCSVKGNNWNWRVQNMILASDIPLLTSEQKEKLNIHGY